MHPQPARKNGIIILISAVGVVVLALGLFVGLTGHVMATLRQGLLDDFREQTGYELSYESLSPSFFRFLEIRNLAVKSRGADARTVVNVETVRIHYRFFDLFFSADRIRAVDRIELERGFLAVDAERDRPLLDFMEGLLNDPSDAFRLSPQFAFSAKNVTLSYRNESAAWSLNDLFASLTSRAGSLLFTLHSRGEAALTNGDGAAAFSTGLDVSGRVDTAFSVLDADVRVQSFQAGDIVLKDQQFHIGLKERRIEVTKVQDRSPIDLTLAYSFDEDLLTANVLAQDWRAGDLITFSDGLASLRPALAARVSADGALRYQPSRNDLSFSFEVAAGLPESASPVAAGLKARITGTAERVEFAPLAISSEFGQIEFRGNVLYKTFLPEGRLRFSNVRTALSDDLNADLAIDRSADGVTVTGEKILIGSTGFRSFVLDIFPRADRATFTLASALDLPLREHRLNLDGVLTYGGRFGLTLDGDLSLVPLNLLYRAFTTASEFSPGLDGFLSPALLSSRCTFATDFETFTFRSPEMTIRDQENPANRVVFDFSADERTIDFERVSGTWAGYDVSGKASLTRQADASFDFAAGVAVNGENYGLTGRSIPGAGLFVSGSHDFALLVVPRRDGGHFLSAQAVRFPVPVAGRKIFATFDWIGSLSAAGGLELVSRSTSLSGLPALLPGMTDASADLQFTLDNNHLHLSKIVVRDAISTLSGNGAVEFAAAPESYATGWIDLADEHRYETYSGFFELSGAARRIDLTFGNSPLDRLGDIPLRGGVSGRMSWRGPVDDPTVSVVFALNRARFNYEAVSLNADLVLSRAGLRINALEASYAGDFTLTAGRGGYSAADGLLQFAATLKGGVDSPLLADLDFEATVSEPARAFPPVSLLEQAVTGRLKVNNLAPRKGEQAEWDLSFAYDRGNFEVSGGPGDILRGVVRRDGYFLFDLYPPFDLQGRFEGSVANGIIEARVEDLVIHLPVLNLLTNTPYFVIREGTARGDLTVSGPVVDPDFFGVLTVDGLAANSAAFVDPIEPFQTLIEARAKSVQIRSVRPRVGNTPLDLQAEMTIDHWGIAQFTTVLAVTDPAGVHVRLPLDIISFDGFVTTPGISISATPAGLGVKGTVSVRNADVVLGTPARPKEEDDANLEVNLTLHTGKQVEWYWPVREMPILRMISEPGAALSIVYDKAKNEFALNGDIRFKGGNVYYFERNFLIREGSLSLRESQLDFNPMLNLKAERKVRYNDQDVKITLLVPNQRLKSFAPEFESDPPLPITERYLALGGIIQKPKDANDPNNQKTEEYFSSVVSDIGGDVLTQIVLLRPLEDKVKDLLNLDGFTIRTPFIKNLLFDTLLNTDTTLPDNRPVNMARYLDNTEISFQKYLDEQNNLFFETIVRFQSDLLPGQAAASSELFGNVNVESEFSLELTTPFFLTIKWSVTPEHWESFFLPDNKITFKWGISF